MQIRKRNCPNEDCRHPMKMFASFCPKCGTESRSFMTYILTVAGFLAIFIIISLKGGH